MLAFLLSAIFVLLLLSMFFSLAESAFCAVNRIKLHILCRQGDKNALRVQKLLQDKTLLVNTMLLLNDFTAIMLSTLLAFLFITFLSEKYILASSSLSTLLLILLGDSIPKNLAATFPTRISCFLSLPVLIFIKIAYPFVYVVNAFSDFLLKLSKKKPLKKDESTYNTDDIKLFIFAGLHDGVVTKEEKSMMSAVLELEKSSVKVLMKSRNEIKAVHISSKYEEIMQIVKAFPYSHFPVYNRNMDEIVGVLHTKDFFCADKKSFNLKKIMRKPLFIPATKSIDFLLEKLHEKRQEMALVTDEYAGTLGLVTYKDVYKALLHSEMQSKNSAFIVKGGILLSEINENLSINLKSKTSETLSGYISEKLDKVIEKADMWTEEGYEFRVEKAEHRRALSIRIEKIKENGKEK